MKPSAKRGMKTMMVGRLLKSTMNYPTASGGVLNPSYAIK